MDRLQEFQYADKLIPSLFPLASLVAGEIKSNSLISPGLSRYENLISIWARISSELSQSQEELFGFCEKEWKKLAQFQDGHICGHSLAAVCTVFTLPEFEEMNFHDQNIVVLGLVFHDISKRGRPLIKGKDPIHPFASAATTLQIFHRLGWIKNSEGLEETVDFINSAYFVHNGKEFMDNSKLEEIFRRLFYATGLFSSSNQEFRDYFQESFKVPVEKLFVFEILAVILMHQSVDLDPKYPNFTPLGREQICKFFTPRLLFLLTVLHLGDNASYELPKCFDSWTVVGRVWDTYRKLERRLTRRLKKRRKEIKSS